jgi:hypothetical protein
VTPDSQRQPTPGLVERPSGQAAPGGNPEAPPSPGPGAEPGPRLRTAANQPAADVPPPTAAAPAARKALPPLQRVNDREVTLEYELTKVGPSGVGSVELYLTRDDGRTWEHCADDSDLTPPITANLPGEGVYGLRLVVRSRAGLGGKPPQPGDAPQLRLEVDTTPPVAKLGYPQPDAHSRDALLLTWNASDPNLAPNPITLQWAPRPDGPWQTIAADQANSGRYTWKVTRDMPIKVYLRLQVKDTAGNVGVDETPEAVLIDLTEPEGQILGLVGSARKP